MINPIDLEAVRDEILMFRRRFRALMIAACDLKAYPYASRAPYVALDGKFYLYVSDMVLRSQHLLEDRPCQRAVRRGRARCTQSVCAQAAAAYL